MRTNTARQALRAGETTVGSWLSLPDPFCARYMARVGFDWLNVELEHSPTSFETAALMFAAIAAEGGVPLARVPWATGENVKRVLDAGAWGVVFPMQNTPEEAAQAVAWCRYPPAGCRGMGGSLAAMSFEAGAAEYYARANEEILVVVQIEHIDAVSRCREILSVPGVDAAFIGPADLGASMGLPPGSDDPRLEEAIVEVCKAATEVGVAPGIHVFNAEAVRERMAQGFRFIALQTDAGFMVNAASEALSQVRGG